MTVTLNQQTVPDDEDTPAESPDFLTNAIENGSSDATELELAKTVQDALKRIEEVSGLIEQQSKDINRQRGDITAIQAIVILGFILALITLGCVIVTDWSFMENSNSQITQQTTLLQRIYDKSN